MSTAEKRDPPGVSLAEAKASFFDLVSQVETKGGEVVLTRRGKPVAKLVPIGEPLRKTVEFGFQKGNITYQSGETFSIDENAWGDLHDAAGKTYVKP